MKLNIEGLLQNGYFSCRMEDMCSRLGADITLLKSEWGTTIDVNQVINHLKNNTYDVVAMVHAETSTGVRNDVETIAKYIDDTDTVELLGWEYKKEILKAPTRDFGYGIVNHYIPKNNLKSIESLKNLLEVSNDK